MRDAPYGHLTQEEVLERIVLQEPWNRGYGGFDLVKRTEFSEQRPRPAQPQLAYDPFKDALTVISGRYDIHDDNGNTDEGWEVTPQDVRRLTIPLKLVLKPAYARYGFIGSIDRMELGTFRVMAKQVLESGCITFSYCPTEDQQREIASMVAPSGASLPSGEISYERSYGDLELTLVRREDSKVGLIIGTFTQMTESRKNSPIHREDVHFEELLKNGAYGNPSPQTPLSDPIETD